MSEADSKIQTYESDLKTCKFCAFRITLTVSETEARQKHLVKGIFDYKWCIFCLLS